jgi:hypothetical protein
MSHSDLPLVAPPSANRSDPLGAIRRVAAAPGGRTAHDVNGRDGLWWAACAARRDDLGRLTSGDIETVLERLRDEAVDAPTGERLVRDGSAVVAAALALSSSDSAERRRQLDRLADRWGLSRALPVGAAPSGLPFGSIGADEPRLAAALVDLATLPVSPARCMASLVLVLLCLPPDPGQAPIATHVLLDADTQGSSVAGTAARLEICELPGGPPGLYPVPRSMSFFNGDQRFQRSLAMDWEAAGNIADPPCVLWRLRGTEPMDGHPIALVASDSAGAAFAVLLTALLRQRSDARGARAPIGRARRRRGRVTLTGPVGADRTIGRVGGVSAKLTAAHALTMRPILLAANRGAGEQVPGGIEPAWIETVDDGYRLATQWPPKYRRAGIGVAVAAALAAGVVWLVTYVQGDASRHAEIATRLVNAALEEQDQDPGLAALLAAQANARAPEGGSRTTGTRELVRQLTHNGRYDGSAEVDAGRATATAAAAAEGQALLAGADRGDILATGIGEHTGFTRELDVHSRVGLIAVNPVVPSQFATAGGDAGPVLWRLEGGRTKGGPRPDLGPGVRGTAWSAAFSPDGLVLAVGDDQGWVTFNAATSARLGTVRPHLTLPMQGGAITAVAFGPPGSGVVHAATAVIGAQAGAALTGSAATHRPIAGPATAITSRFTLMDRRGRIIGL